MTDGGLARAELDQDGPAEPGRPRFLLVLTHGAGGSPGHPTCWRPAMPLSGWAGWWPG